MHQVRYFLAAAQHLSFTRAAEACHVSQPALTAAMRKLEAELGSLLFIREANRLQLSAFGRQMAPLLAGIAERTEAAQAAAEAFRLLRQPPVRLGAMPTLGPARLARFLAEFERTHPGIEVAVSEGRPAELARLMADDRLDAAILNPAEGPGDSIRIEPLYIERYVVLLPPGHALRERNALSLADLDGAAYVDRLACEMREAVMGVCDARAVRLYARFRSEREDWVQAMVAAGLGFAFVPEYSISPSGAIQRPLTDPAVLRTVALATRPGRPHAPGVQRFLRAVRAHRWLE